MTSLLFYFLVPGGLQNLTRIQIGDCDTLHVRMVSFVHFSMRAETNPPGKKIKHPRAIIGGGSRQEPLARGENTLASFTDGPP